MTFDFDALDGIAAADGFDEIEDGAELLEEGAAAEAGQPATPGQLPAPEIPYRDRKAEIEHARELRDSITLQLRFGNAPELILYTAIEALGLLASADEWAAECTRILKAAYPDIGQLAFYAVNVSAAAERFDRQRREYIDKTRKQLQARLTSGNQFIRHIIAAMQTLTDLENAEPDGVQL
jgi:hypothetical protein